jgi:hypothetical protein
MLFQLERKAQSSVTQALAGRPGVGATVAAMTKAQSRDVVKLGLIFDAIKDQLRILDERCEDPALTTFILAIDALSQNGFDECERLTLRRKAWPGASA